MRQQFRHHLDLCLRPVAFSMGSFFLPVEVWVGFEVVSHGLSQCRIWRPYEYCLDVDILAPEAWLWQAGLRNG